MTNQAAVRPVPLARPNVSDLEVALVKEVLESGTLSMGQFTSRFEEMLSSMVERRFGIAVSSGTAGLHLVVRALGLGPGAEVLTTPFSFVASANCLLYEGAIPRFVDIEEDTLGIDPALAAEAVTDRTRGIIAVDVFGAPAQMVELSALAGDRGLHLIEDSCEALGSSLGGRALGSFGAASVFAFYANKQITTGEGGMVVTDDERLARTIRSARNQGRDDSGTWLTHVQLGYNYRIDEMSAALGVAQLTRYAELRDGRARTFEAYRKSLDGLGWARLPQAPPDSEVDWFVYVIRVLEGVDRNAIIEALGRRGVAARPYFSPLHLQPLYRERFGHAPGDFPVTERVAASTIALPFSSLHSAGDVDRVAEALMAAGQEQGLD